MNKIKSNSKALSGLVATSLLLLIGIMVFGTFQVWYLNYSDDVMDTFEEISPSQIVIEKFEGNLLYVKNTAISDLNITEIKIGNITYDIHEIVTKDNLTIINISDYLGHSNPNVEEITLISDKGVFSENKIIITEFSYAIMGVNDQSGFSNCSKLNSANDKVVEVFGFCRSL